MAGPTRTPGGSALLGAGRGLSAVYAGFGPGVRIPGRDRTAGPGLAEQSCGHSAPGRRGESPMIIYKLETAQPEPGLAAGQSVEVEGTPDTIRARGRIEP